jgi:hypothetical protein
MDWSSEDYSRVYADTFVTPAPEAGSGIYLLDEAERGAERGADRRADRRADPRGARRPPREGYYTGGNIVSDRENSRAVFDVAWDERPPRGGSYSYGDGGDPRLVPPRWAHAGPPAFPLTTQSEGLNNPSAIRLPSFASECFATGPAGAAKPAPCGCHGRPADWPAGEYLKVVLLIIIVVLLAVAVTAAGRTVRGLEDTVRAAVEAFRAERLGSGRA